MGMPGRQWGYIELRCPSRAVQVFGELPQAYGGLYDNSAHSDIGGRRSQNNGRTAFGTCPGIETNQGRAVQYVQCHIHHLSLNVPTGKFTRKLLGESEIEAVLQRLDRLTREEARITVAQTLGVVHGLVGSIKVVMEGASVT